MANEEDGARRPPQAYDTVSPAGVGTTTTNQVSPGTIQEIIDTEDRSLVDQAFDQMTVEDMTASAFGAASPAGVGSQASHTPSTDGARTPHRGSPRLSSSSGARTPLSQGSARLVAAAGAGGGGGGGGDDDDDGRGGRGRRSTPPWMT